jgi:hypothetical protein
MTYHNNYSRMFLVLQLANANDKPSDINTFTAEVCLTWTLHGIVYWKVKSWPEKKLTWT